MESFDRDSECGVGGKEGGPAGANGHFGGGGRRPRPWMDQCVDLTGTLVLYLSLYLGDLTDVTRICSSLPKLRLTQIGNSPSSLPSLPAALLYLPCVVVHCSLFVQQSISSLPSPLPSYCTLEGNTCPKSHNFPSRPAFLSILQLVGIYKSYAANTPPYKKKNRSFGLLVVRWSCDCYSLGKQNKKSIHTTLTDRHISSRK